MCCLRVLKAKALKSGCPQGWFLLEQLQRRICGLSQLLEAAAVLSVRSLLHPQSLKPSISRSNGALPLMGTSVMTLDHLENPGHLPSQGPSRGHSCQVPSAVGRHRVARSGGQGVDVLGDRALSPTKGWGRGSVPPHTLSSFTSNAVLLYL